MRACIIDAVEKLPRYAKVHLSGLAFEEDEDSDGDESLGGIWVDGIANLIQQARNLLDSIDISTLVGLRDRALTKVMIFAFARIGAVVSMRVEDYYTKGQALVGPTA